MTGGTSGPGDRASAPARHPLGAASAQPSPMHTLRLTKPDGRALALYSRAPIDPTIRATSPSAPT